MADSTPAASLFVSIEARTTQLERALEKVTRLSSARMREIEQTARNSTRRLDTIYGGIGRSMDAAFNRVGSGIRGNIATLGATLVASLSAGEIAAAAREYTTLTNALRTAGVEGEELDRTFSQLFEIAQRQGTAISPLVGLYSKLSLAQRELGVSGEQLMRFSEGIAVALRAGGVSAEAASGPLLQLSQALGGGVVRAEEFNSLLEGTPTIVQTVARGLTEAGGSVARLRQLVNDGAVSSRAFFDAFLAGFPALADQASRATATTDQGLTRVSNAFVLLVGKLDETTGASRNASASLTAVGDAIAGIPAYIGGAASSFQDLRGWLRDIGNDPFWRRLGEFMGIDYSPEGLAKLTGYTPPAQGGGIGSDRVAGGETATPVPVTPVSLASYPVDATPSKAKSSSGRAKTQTTYDDIAATANERISQLELEQQTLGMTTEAAEALRLKEELLAAVAREQIQLSPEQRADLEAKAEQYGQLAAAIERAAEVQGTINEIGRDAIGGIVADLRAGRSAAEAFGNALDRLADRLLDVGLTALFQANGGGILSGLTALLGFSGGGEIPAFSTGGAVQDRPQGRLTGPGTGTSDSILARVSSGEFIVNADATGKNRALLELINRGKLPAFADGGAIRAPAIPRMGASRIAGGGTAAPRINMPIDIQVNATGGTPEQNADLAERIGEQLEGRMRAVVIEELITQMKPGNILGT